MMHVGASELGEHGRPDRVRLAAAADSGGA